MSKIALSSNTSGTGVFTIASLGTNTDRTLTLPDATTTLVGTDNTQILSNKSFSTVTSVLAATPTGSASIEIGAGRTGDGAAYFDLVGDTTYSDYGTRFIRQGTSAGATTLTHKGIGNLEITAEEAALIVFKTNNVERLLVAADGQIGIGGANYGTSGQTIVSAGASAAPAWGTLPVSGGGTGVTTSTGTGAVVLGTGAVISQSNAVRAAGTLALAFATNQFVQVTPNAAGAFTTTVPVVGTTCTLIVLTSGTTSYGMTFGTGFRTTAALATGTVTAQRFVLQFVSDGTSLIPTIRTAAIA